MLTLVFKDTKHRNKITKKTLKINTLKTINIY